MLGSTDDTFTWEVDAYSTLGPSRKRSGSFLYRDLKWSLLLDPKGDDKSAGHLSLYLNLDDAANFAEGLTFSPVFTLVVVNQKSSSQNVSCRVEDAKINAAASGWGKREFIKLDSIRTDSGFIDGDKLIIRCQMHAVDTVFWEINNFSTLTAARKRSNSFTYGALKWSILLDPKGDEKSGHVSLYLNLDEAANFFDGLTFSPVFTLTAVNQRNAADGFACKVEDAKINAQASGWGKREFAKLDQLTNGFLEGDKLLVRLQMHSVDTVYWEISEFSKLGSPRKRSPHFTWGNLKWTLLLDPKGDDKSGHLSLYLNLDDAANFTEGLTFSPIFTLSVVNQQRPSGSVPCKVEDAKINAAASGWGKREFVKLDQLRDGFLKDDKLVVKAQMHSVDAVHWEVTDFSRLSATRKSSQWFPYGGQRWCMFLDPKGDEKSDQFSVFLNLVDATSLADGLSLNRVFSLSLLSQRPNTSTTISRRVDDAKFHAKLSGWGYRDFAKTDILSTGYLEQDKLVLPTQIHGVDTIMWEVSDFSKLAASRKRSGSFHFGGLKWSLLLDPKGDEKSAGFLSLYLNLDDAPNLVDGLTFSPVFTLTVVNQRNPAQNVACRVEDAKINASASGWGKREFIKLDQLKDRESGFVDGDKLIIKVQMHTVDTYHWEVDGFAKLGATRKRSSSFVFGGLKWSLLLDPKGDEKSGHVSLYLNLDDATAFTEGLTFAPVFSLMIINRRNPADVLPCKVEDARISHGASGWGKREFCRQDQITGGFIEGDKLMIRVQLHSVDTVYWDINEFSRLGSSRKRSPAFSFGNLKWSLLLDPKGDEKSGHSSLYLNLDDATNFTDGLMFAPVFTLTLLNQRNPSNNIACRVEDAKINASASGWGKREFVKLDQLRDGFTDNDKMIVRIQMHATDTVVWEVKDFSRWTTHAKSSQHFFYQGLKWSLLLNQKRGEAAGGLTAFLNLCEATSFTDGLFFRPSFTVSLSSSRSAAARIARRIDDSRIEARASASGQELCKLDQLFSPYLVYDKMTLSAQFKATHGDAKDFAPANVPGVPEPVMRHVPPAGNPFVGCPKETAKKFVGSLGIADAFMSTSHDRCFCDTCGPFPACLSQAGENYEIPRGWCGFGLKVAPRAEALRIWDTWHVAYHGCPPHVVSSILAEGQLLMPGDTLLDGTKLGAPHTLGGEGRHFIYTSPSYLYSSLDVYTSPSTWNKHRVRVMLQCRQKPGSYQVSSETIGWERDHPGQAISPNFPNSRLERATRARGAVVPYRLLVKLEPLAP